MRTIEDAAIGMERQAKRALGEKMVVPPKPADTRREFLSEAGTAFTRMPASEGALTESVNAIYEARAQAKGWADPKPDEWRKILKEVVGETTDAQGNKFGGMVDMGAGHKAIVPMNVKNEGGWFKNSTFGQLLDAVRHEDLIDAFGSMPMSENGTPLSMAKVRGGKLVTIGDGRYYVATGDLAADDPQFVRDGTGKNFVLDLKALEPKLRQRRPDLYKGYEVAVQGEAYDPITSAPVPTGNFAPDMAHAESLARGIANAAPKGYTPGPTESDNVVDDRASTVIPSGRRDPRAAPNRIPMPRAEDAPDQVRNLLPR